MKILANPLGRTHKSLVHGFNVDSPYSMPFQLAGPESDRHFSACHRIVVISLLCGNLRSSLAGPGIRSGDKI